MKLSELITKLEEVMAVHGDVTVYHGDMLTLDFGHIDMIEANEEFEPEKYGDKYLHLGKW